jgi:hypothetical protein
VKRKNITDLERIDIDLNTASKLLQEYYATRRNITDSLPIPPNFPDGINIEWLNGDSYIDGS